MIKYKKDIIQMLSNKGITTYYIRKNKIFNEYQLYQIRHNRLVKQETLDKLCTLLECQPGHLLEYVYSEDMNLFKKKTLDGMVLKNNVRERSPDDI